MTHRTSKSLALATALLLVAPLFTSGCTVLVAGAAAGGGGYETYQNEQMQKLEQDYAAGKISQADYEARKARIQQSSLLQ